MALGKNICIAPFTQITYGPFDSASPCPYLGGKAWNFENKSLGEIWTSPEAESLRDSFRRNKKDVTCNRCWDEEDHGKQSARKLLLTTYKHKAGIIDDIKSGNYLEGPRQINLRVGNLCNLRCRSCCSLSSVTYAVEGRDYNRLYDLKDTLYTKYPNLLEFTDQQIDEIFAVTKNVRRIEFYGGEPLLDKPTIRLLEMLIANGKSKEITLFYNTNGTVIPSQRHQDIWKEFESLEFNFSIDGIGDQFTYIRHPGKWEDMLNTVSYIKENIKSSNQAICTVSTFNVYYLPEILAEFRKLELSPFLNLVTDPAYYDIQHMPDHVKSAVTERLKTLPQSGEIASIINILTSPRDPVEWDKFLFWTKAKDSYRKESFSSTFPELFNLI